MITNPTFYFRRLKGYGMSCRCRTGLRYAANHQRVAATGYSYRECPVELSSVLIWPVHKISDCVFAMHAGETSR